VWPHLFLFAHIWGQRKMKIAMASDHAGFSLKEEIAGVLKGQGHEVEDFGAFSESAVDLSDHVYPAALAVGEGRVERGIFVDGVGYGSALIANRIYGVYAAVCQDPFCAGLARSHSDTNVLCIGGKIIGSALALEIVKTWMSTEFLGSEEKYKRRVNKVQDISRRHLKPLPVE
jgi:ribose 5-phosphate isomerase B